MQKVYGPKMRGMKAKRKHLYAPDYAVPPGDTLQETLDALGMSQKDLAARTGMSEVSINRIVKDHQPITHETANKLELVTGVPARFWNNLESNYREQLAKVAERLRNPCWVERICPVGIWGK